MSAPLVSLRAMRARVAWLIVGGGLFLCAPSGHPQTVSANFGSRSGSTPAVPAGLFSVGGSGSTITEQGPLGTIAAAGFDQMRIWVDLHQIFANPSAPYFNALDKTLEAVKSSGFHPLAVIYNTPASLAWTPCAPPSNIWQWGQMAAKVVAHLDEKFPWLVRDYEIWNEPELATSLCISNPTTRMDTYIAMFAEAAGAMHKQAAADGETIRTGGPVISQLSQGSTWIPALLKNTSAAPYVDFVSFHLYVTGQNNIDAGMTWSQLYTITQSSTRGLGYYYKNIESLVRGGYQPNAASTPIYITEFNDNWAYAIDCCRNNPTFAPLWNSTAIVDLLNVVHSGANAVPSQLSYFSVSGSYFCILGQWNSSMNCNASANYPYPQYYAYKLFASADYLDLQAGGHMATSVSPANTTWGLNATAFYTSSADDVVIINPTASDQNSVTVDLANLGFSSPHGTLYLLNSSHGTISTESVTLQQTSTGYSARVAVPAYSTVALSVKGGSTGTAPSAVLKVSTSSGTHPLTVTVDSSGSTGGSSAIAGRTTSFGDGSYLSWYSSAAHLYSKPGKYFIGVTVTNESGQYSSTGATITVY